MPIGISVLVVDDKVHVSFPDRSKRGVTLAEIVREIPPRDIRVDTSGSLKTYILPIEGARAVGLLDDTAPVKDEEPAEETTEDDAPAETPKKAPAKRAPKKATEAVSDESE